MQRAGVAHRLSQSMDELLRETVRALAKLSALRQNQRPLVESEQVAGRHCLHLLHPLLHLHLLLHLLHLLRLHLSHPRSEPPPPLQLHLIVKLMGSSETSLGVKAECLELLGHLADVPQAARNSGATGAILRALLRNYSDALPPSLSCSACPSSSPTASSAR